jgi:hypothetical protein
MVRASRRLTGSSSGSSSGYVDGVDNDGRNVGYEYECSCPAGYEEVDPHSMHDHSVPHECIATPAPTAAPTAAPTDAPTDAPTPAPTHETMSAVLSTDSMALVEGTSGQFAVLLKYQPPVHATTFVVSFVFDDTELELTPSSISFDHEDWNASKFVLVSAVADGVCEDFREKSTIDASVAVAEQNGMQEFTGRFETATLDVFVQDIDAGITLSTESIMIGEASSSTYSVRLCSQPNATTEVMIGFDAASMASARAGGFTLSVNPTVLRFTTTSWAQDVDITVMYENDDRVTGNSTFTLSNSVQLSADPRYQSISASLSVTCLDSTDDVAGISITLPAENQMIVEGPLPVLIDGNSIDATHPATAAVRLESEPLHNVTVYIETCEVAGATSIDVRGSSAIFTPGNWQQDQDITVFAVNDADASEDAQETVHTCTFTTASTDPHYQDLHVSGLTKLMQIAVIDNDRPLQPSAPTVFEVSETDWCHDDGSEAKVMWNRIADFLANGNNRNTNELYYLYWHEEVAQDTTREQYDEIRASHYENPGEFKHGTAENQVYQPHSVTFDYLSNCTNTDCEGYVDLGNAAPGSTLLFAIRQSKSFTNAIIGKHYKLFSQRKYFTYVVPSSNYANRQIEVSGKFTVYLAHFTRYLVVGRCFNYA